MSLEMPWSFAKCVSTANDPTHGKPHTMQAVTMSRGSPSHAGIWPGTKTPPQPKKWSRRTSTLNKPVERRNLLR